MNFFTLLKFWLLYFNSFFPAVPQMGQVEDGDCIFVQSFGRNRYGDVDLGRLIWNIRGVHRTSDIEALSLLMNYGFDPGKSNYALAQAAMNLCNKYRIPIIAQWEVVFAIYHIDFHWYTRNQHFIDTIWPPQQGYFATAHVKQISIEWMRNRGLGKPIEIAHPAMIARAIPIIWALGVIPIVQEVRMGKAEQSDLWMWDENSIQPWTRSWNNWRMREFQGRIAHVVSHLLGMLGLLPAFKALMPVKLKDQIPGDWIVFSPPKASRV